MGRREKILQIASRMAELRAELARLDAEFAALIPEDGDAHSRREACRPSKEDFLSSRMLRLMGSEPEHSFDAPEVVRSLALERDKIDQVRAAFSRLRKAGRIRRVREGKYRACVTDLKEPPLLATAPSGAVEAGRERKEAG